MKPVRVSIDVPQARENVYDYLDVMANHETFNDHVLKDWEYFGPPSGLGSGARVRASIGGRTDHVSIEVIDGERPVRITERNTGAGGRRVATGTYELAEHAGRGTQIAFIYTWERVPLEERLAAPLVRAIMRRAYGVSMERLSERLAAATR